ncbi:hypothetical protein [Pseudoroseicyclus sp. CXY001]|uniref:hypothetical protein n=1 Tax=Pseudoroseicyclus sp. CXY001 TaxID=3242492 RepID=UPI0035713C9C
MGEEKKKLPDKLPASARGKVGRAALNTLGAVPFAGGLFSAAAGFWGEREEEKVNEFLRSWIEMLRDEVAEKERTILEIMARLDVHDEKIQERITEPSFQSLIKKSFRDWPVAESEDKRIYLRNLLSNAASAKLVGDDVVRLFVDWLRIYSNFHFQVIAAIYNSAGISRGEIWDKIGKDRVPENSADADLFKLLVRDLSTGSVIRQYRPTDGYGNFLKNPSRKGGRDSTTLKSAFDREEGYELTALGQQFVHYAMTELPPKLEFQAKSP